MPPSVLAVDDMLFFNTQRLIVYLKNNSLEIYKGKNKTAEINYPVNTIKFLEIIDSNTFEKFLNGIFPKTGLGSQKITLILDNNMVFQKILPRDKVQEELETQKFIEKIPFNREQLVFKKIANDKWLAIVATPKNFYQPIKKMLEKSGYLVEAVVPASVFGNIGDTIPLNQDNIWQKINDDKLIASGNFLS